jgi:hypothetical protein
MEANPDFTGICRPGTHCGAMTIENRGAIVSSSEEQAVISAAECAGSKWLGNNDEGDAHINRDAHGDDELMEEVVGLSEAITDEPKSTILPGVPDNVLFTWNM